MKNEIFDGKLAISLNYPVTFRNSAAKFARYIEIPKSDPFTGLETGQRPFYSGVLSVVLVLVTQNNVRN